MSRLIRGFAGGATVRFVAVSVRDLAEEARRAHRLGPAPSVFVGQAIAATALLSAHVKGAERLTLAIEGSRPAFLFNGEIDAEGALRARLTPADLGRVDRFDGVLMAIKSDAEREVYRGATAIENQTLEAALEGHLVRSEQVDAFLRLDTELDADGSLAFAGGILVERLPADPKHPSISPEEFAERWLPYRAMAVEELLVALSFGKLGEGEVHVLDDRPLRWQCRCSAEKVEATLGSLGVAELRQMQAEGGAEVTCHYCNRTYQVSAERLGELAALYDRIEFRLSPAR